MFVLPYSYLQSIQNIITNERQVTDSLTFIDDLTWGFFSLRLISDMISDLSTIPRCTRFDLHCLISHCSRVNYVNRRYYNDSVHVTVTIVCCFSGV